MHDMKASESIANCRQSIWCIIQLGGKAVLDFEDYFRSSGEQLLLGIWVRVLFTVEISRVRYAVD